MHDLSQLSAPAPMATSNWRVAAVGPRTPSQQLLRCPHPQPPPPPIHSGMACKPYNRQGRVACMTPAPSSPSILSPSPDGGTCVSGSQTQGKERAHHLGDDSNSSRSKELQPWWHKKVQQRHRATPLTEKVESRKCHSDVLTSGSSGKKN